MGVSYIYLHQFNTFMGKRKRPINFDGQRLSTQFKKWLIISLANVSLLRFWEKEFDNINRKTKGGTRQYTKKMCRR